MSHSDDLNMASDIPFGLTLLTTLDRALNWLLRHLVIVGWCLIFFMSIVLSSRIRSYTDSFIGSALIIILLAIVFAALGYVSSQWTGPRVARLALGRPLYGQLGGPPNKIFFIGLQASSAVHIEFSGDDLETMKAFNRMDHQLTEHAIKETYRSTLTEEEEKNFETEWPAIWKEKFLKIHTGGITIADSFAEDAHSFRIIPGRLAATAALLASLVDIFQAIMVFSIALYLNRSIELVNVLQIGLLLIFLLALLLFLHHSFQLNEYALGQVAGLPPETLEHFADQIDSFKGKRVIAKRVTADRNYLSAVRNYFMRYLRMTFLASAHTLILTGFTVLIGLIFFNAQKNEWLPWYRDIAIGIVLLPIALMTGFYLTFLLLQSFGKIMAPVIAGLLGALLPFGFEFIATGSVDWSKAGNALAAAASGAAALIVTAITSQVKSRLEQA